MTDTMSPSDVHSALADAAHKESVTPLMTARELVDYLRLPTLDALYTMRTRGGGPPAVRIQRQLLFRRADVEAWLASRVEA
jgi:hypothetical protein